MPRLPAHERDDDLNQASNDPHETEGVGVLVTEALASAHSARRSFTDWCQQQHVEHMALTHNATAPESRKRRYRKTRAATAAQFSLELRVSKC